MLCEIQLCPPTAAAWSSSDHNRDHHDPDERSGLKKTRFKSYNSISAATTTTNNSRRNTCKYSTTNFYASNLVSSNSWCHNNASSFSGQVVQSLRLQSASKHYSELGSCPSLNTAASSSSGSGSGGNQHNAPLLARELVTTPASTAAAANGKTNGGQAGGGGGAMAPIEEFVQTSRGQILVARQGDPRKPVLITYHDIGLNYQSNFQAFFKSGAMANVLDTFCLYHVTAPGQESGAKDLPEGYVYPTMDELSDQVEYVIHYYGISHCIGFGVGLGANVLVRLAHRRPTMIDGLILVNCNSQSAGWLEWVYHKVNIKSLRKLQQQQAAAALHQGSDHPPPRPGLPDSVVDYLIWYHLGRPDSGDRPLEAVSIALIYKQHFHSASGGEATQHSARNLAMLLQAYMARNDLGLAREVASNGKPMLGATRTLRMPVLNMTGDQSPHVDATVVFNGRLQPNKCTWMKFQDSAMILEEQPAKVAEAVKLFLQGLGHTLRRPSMHRTSSLASSGGGHSSTSSPAPRNASILPHKSVHPPPLAQRAAAAAAASGVVCQTDILVEGLDELQVSTNGN